MNENIQGNEENRMPASEVLEDRTDHPLLHSPIPKTSV